MSSTDSYKIIATKKQKEAHEALKNNTIVLFGGAIRGSKSYWGIMEIITLCFQYPNSRWLMCRKTWDNIKNKLLVTFTENFLEKGLEAYVKSFQRDTYILTFNNGSQLVFMPESYESDKDLNRFRGLEINGAFIDEVNEIQEKTFNKIIERSGSWFHSPNCPIKIIMSCNPTRNWVKTRFYDLWKNNELPKNVAYIPAKITDNPYVSKEYIETLKLLPQYEYEVFVNGNWDVNLKTGNEFYRSFDLDKHVRNIDFDSDKTIHVTIDDNALPYIAVSFWQIYEDDKMIKQIHELPCSDPYNTAKRAAEQVNEYLQSIGYEDIVYIYGDQTTKQRNTIDEQKRSFYQIFEEQLSKEFHVIDRLPSKNPPVALTGEFINALYENWDGWQLAINETCKTSISDYIDVKINSEGGMQKKKYKDNEIGASYELNGHFSDIKRYFITEVIPAVFRQWRDRFSDPTEYDTVEVFERNLRE